MKKIQIEGTNATILKNIDGQMIRKKRIKGLNAYPRTIPEDVILKLIDRTNVKHPRLIKSSFNSVDIEYINGKCEDIIDKNMLINIVSNYIFEMSKIDCESLKKYIKWSNNSSFLYYQVNNLLLVIRKSGYIDKLKQLGINFSGLLAFKNVKLFDQRRMSLIHGDITSNNIIQNNGQYILVDWELATYGDIAYDLALHFNNENYTSEEMAVVIDRLTASLLLDPKALLKDIRIYLNFENYRKSIVGFIESINLKKKGSSNEMLLQETYKYYSKLPKPLPLDTIRMIINN